MVDGNTVLLCRVEDRRGFSAPDRGPVPRRILQLGGRRPSAAGADARRPAGDVGGGGPAAHLGRRAGRLGHRLHGFRTRRTRPVAWPRRRTSDRSKRLGVVRAPEDKNGALLSRRVNGDLVMFHRPVTARRQRADVWISRSPDLHSWSAPEPVLARPRGRLVGLRPDRDRPSADGDAQGVAAGRTATRYLRPRHWKQTATRCGCGRAELHAGNRDSSAGRRCSSGASESSQVSQPAMTSDRPTHRSPLPSGGGATVGPNYYLRWGVACIADSGVRQFMEAVGEVWSSVTNKGADESGHHRRHHRRVGHHQSW